MCTLHRVRWTITPRFSPQPWIACSGCGTQKPFQSSGKIRLNANGKKLDAWLIYRCRDCKRTWNRPLFERAARSELDSATLDALHFSDPDWVRTHEFAIDDLRRRASHVDEYAEADIVKETLSGVSNSPAMVIELKVALSSSLRLDRLLSTELGVSRARLRVLYERGLLRVESARRDALRRRIKDGMEISLDCRIGFLPSPCKRSAAGRG